MDRALKFKVFLVDSKTWYADGVPFDLNYSFHNNCFMYDNDNYDTPEGSYQLFQLTTLKGVDDSGNPCEVYDGAITSEGVVFWCDFCQGWRFYYRRDRECSCSGGDSKWDERDGDASYQVYGHIAENHDYMSLIKGYE